MPLEDESFVDRARFGDCYMAYVMPGEELLEKIAEFARIREIRRLVILSAIGSVTDVSFRNLKSNVQLPLRAEHWSEGGGAGPYELVALSGNMVPMGGEPVLNVHAMLGTPEGTVIGGRLDRAVAFTGVELVFSQIEDSHVVKQPDERTGLAQMRTVR